jgi:hypothetical protein
MRMDADLKKLERRAYLTFFEDGLWDICLGLLIIVWGLMLTLEFSGVIGGIWVAAYFIIVSLKRWLTYPRTGYIKISGSRRQQIKLVILGTVLFLLGLVVFFLFNASRRPAWLDEYFMLMFSTMTAVVIALLGYWWKVLRWYVYAGMVFIAAAVYQWLDTPLNLTFVVPGGIMTSYGLVLLIKFLRKYPKAKGEIDAVP